jgi:4-amino-4-deoxychorismate lyase
MPAEGALRDGTTAGFELIETLRWEPEEGFVRLERHLSRLAKSARTLGFSHDEREIREVLNGCAGGEAALRVRLTLAKDGRIGVTNAPFEPLPTDAVWTLRIATTRLNSADPLLRHKTTWRQVYEAARAEFSRGEADEVLLLNERSEVCEGTITNVFIDIGEPVLVTPALGSGLLPGVLRGEMIEQGKARDAVLSEADLQTAKAIYVGNSLRGLIVVRLASD